jgi:hypothetical protein
MDHAAALRAGVDLADHVGATDLQARATRFASDPEWLHSTDVKKLDEWIVQRLGTKPKIGRVFCADLLSPTSYHARAIRPVMVLPFETPPAALYGHLSPARVW